MKRIILFLSILSVIVCPYIYGQSILGSPIIFMPSLTNFVKSAIDTLIVSDSLNVDGHLIYSPTTHYLTHNGFLGVAGATVDSSLTATGGHFTGGLKVDKKISVSNTAYFADDVGIGTANPKGTFQVQNGGSSTNIPSDATANFVGTPYSKGVIGIYDISTLNVGVGGGIDFGGYYTGTTHTQWAAIKGSKESAVDGEYGGYFSIFTRPNGGATTEQVRVTSNGNVGIGTTAPDKACEINSATGINLRLTYNDADGSAANYTDFDVSSSGDLTITPSGGKIYIDGSLSVNGDNSRVKFNTIGDIWANGSIMVNNQPIGIDETKTITVNATSALTTPTYDGSGQVVHPDIYYNPLGWPNSSGHKYWMAITPFPSGVSSYENPSILVSDDGQTWSVPSGLTNPIVPAPGTGYNSDSDILEGADGKLWVFYRWTDGTTEKLYVKSSSDGITWSSAEEILSSTTERFISPAVVYNDGTYIMWYVNTLAWHPNEIKKRTCTTPNGTWSSAVSVSFTNVPTLRDLWHLDVLRNNEEYVSYIVLADSGTGGGNAKLRFAKSDDGGLNWDMNDEVLLDKSSSGWDNDLIYRSSGALIDKGDEKVYGLWYSARNTSNVWHLGYTEIKLGKTVVSSNVSNPPTDAELDALFTSPVSKDGSWKGIVMDSDSDNMYVIRSDGTYWYSFAGTKAL